MIRFVCGRAGSGKSEFVMNAVRSAGDSGRDVILIVPEQQAVVWESRTARELSPEALMRLEVLTFTRLSDRVAREFGGFFHCCATRPAKQLIMWAALESVRGSLGYYGSARAERLVPALLRTVKELRTYRVTPGMLEEAAAELGSGDVTEALLSRKLADISTVFAAYDELLHQSFSDSEEMPEHTASVISEKNFFRGKSVFIDSFYSVTPAQRDIIRAAMRDADELTVTVACPKNKTAEPQFTHIREHFDRLYAMAEHHGGAEVIALDGSPRFREPALAELERGLWDYSKRGLELPGDGVSIITVKDRYAEADAVAAEICRLVQGGARYSDIAVIARSTESLEGITDAALLRRGIPHYTARRKKLANSPAARLLTAALRVPAYGWRTEDIIAIAKTGLLPFKGDERGLFERYIKMWRIRGQRAYALDGDFGMDPFGYKSSSPERSRAVLDQVNLARRRLCDPLSSFSEIFCGGRATAYNCAVALYKLLTDWGVPEAISASAGRLRELGYTTEAAETMRLWDALMTVLDTLASTIPDASGDAESFAVMLGQIIAATDSGTIPTGIDEVALGSADMMRTDNPKHVIVLGAVDGEFPASVPDDGILSESDRVMLEGCGIELSDTGRFGGAMELFWFYKALSAATDSVTVMIPRYSGRAACTPSAGAVRIRELFPGLQPREYDGDDLLQSVWVNDDLGRFLRLRGAKGELARSLVPDGDSIPPYGEDRRYDSSVEQIPPEIIRQVNGDVLHLTQSKLDKFAGCPFQFAATYTLGLEEDASAELGFSDTGTFVHKILEEFFRAAEEMEFPIPEETELRISDRLVDEYEAELLRHGTAGGRQRFLLNKLRRSIKVFIRSLNREFAQGLFRPWAFEQDVGGSDPGSIPAPVFRLSDGREIRMKGVIDRIDVYRDGGTTYVRVVDYKTGKKEFKLSDIYEGLNLQLLLYLFTVWKSPPGEFRHAIAGDGEIVPAGALYFSARPGETDSDTMLYGGDGFETAVDKVSRTGLVLSDPKILRAMDGELSGRYGVVRLDDKGRLKGEKNLADIERFGELYLEISDIVTRMGNEIDRGFAGAVPKEHGGYMPCDMCGYFPICRRSSNVENAKTEGGGSDE